MNTPPLSRRQFLAALAGLVGVGSGVAWAWQGNAGSEAAIGADASLPQAGAGTAGRQSSTTAGPTTTVPPSSTTSTRVATAETTPPTTTPSTTTTSTSSTTTTAPAQTTTSSTTTSSTTAPTTTSTAPITTTTIGATGTGAVQAICKSAWGGREPSGTLTAHTIARMTVHHTAAFLDTNRKAPARARAHQRFHMDDRGWVDLAYHFLVDANGNVYEGRPVTAVGDTGTNYDPTGHFLVCAEGDFNSQAIPAAQISAVADVLAWGAGHFGVDPSTIRGHRDWAATSCPGDNFYPSISNGTLEQAVRDRIAAGTPALSILCGDTAVQRVADIEAGLI